MRLSSWGCVPVMLAGLLAMRAAAEERPQEISVVVAGKLVRGEMVLPADEKEFKLRSEGALLTLRWTLLDEHERPRVQRLYGLIKNADVDPRSHQPGAPNALEEFQKFLAENPPGPKDAKAHLDLARKAAELGLFEQAVRQLDAAELIDPRTAERNQALRQQLGTQIDAKRVQNLYQQMLREQRGGDNFAALETLDKLERGFPNSELRSRWEALRPVLEAACKRDLKKQVIARAYGVIDELLQQQLASKARVDEKGNVVSAVPGKQVTTRQGKIFRGTLTTEENGDLTLQVGNTALTLKSADVANMQDVDLSVAAREVDRTFDEMKQYIGDTGGLTGLKKQAFARMAKLLKVKEAELTGIFDDRLKRTAVYTESGTVEQSPVYTTLHGASYGDASWLREGARPLPAPNASSGNNTRTYLNGNSNNATVEEDPATSDDPEVWWKHQKLETRLMLLRAISAEKIFSVKSVEKTPCKECSGKGTVRVNVGGLMVNQRCPVCRGTQSVVKIIYE